MISNTIRRLTCVCALIGMLGGAGAVPADAYLQFTIRAGSDVRAVKWLRTPVRYFVTNQAIPKVSANQLQAALARAFATWETVPSAGITFEFAGFTAARPGADDSLPTVGFLDRPDLDRVLGATAFTVDTVTGEIVEADIFLNSTFAWSVAPGGEPGRFDLESIALHEIGHLLGLGHSAIGETDPVAGGRRVTGAEAVMFPIAYPQGSIAGRTLRADDVAGVSDLYPAGDFADRTGSLEGRVTKADGGVFGAHVVAFNVRTGDLVGGFSLTAAGDFFIAGLEPGPYVLRVEPIDDADVSSFFENTSRVDVRFGVVFSPRIVLVHARGAADARDIAVPPR